MSALLNLPDYFDNAKLGFGFSEDFLEFVTGDLFTDTSADSAATVTNADGVGGIITMTAQATDNHEVYLHTTRELFLFAANKPLLVRGRIAFAQANTDDINVAFGLSDAVSSDQLQDNGAGPAASYSGALFFTVDGGLNWYVEASIAGTQTTVELTAANSLDKVAHVAASGASTYQELAIASIPYSSTNHLLNYYINGVHVCQIDHVYTDGTEMQVWVGLKLGGSNIETVKVDRIDAWQKR